MNISPIFASPFCLTVSMVAVAEPSPEKYWIIVICSAIATAILLGFAIQTHVERKTCAITRRHFGTGAMVVIWSLPALMAGVGLINGMML